MVFDVSKVGGIGSYSEERVTLGDGDDAEKVIVFKVGVESAADGGVEMAETEKQKAFLVVRKNTLEVRTDEKLRDLLRTKYESVMESRYFGRGGIEIVDSGQLSFDEICDLVRLSYRMSKEG